jgi:hypothetical protein
MAGRIAYYGGIVLDGLLISLDAANKNSYTNGSSSWQNLTTAYTGSITVQIVASQSFDGISLTANSGSNLAQVQFPNPSPVFVRQEATIEIWLKPPTATLNVNSGTLYFGGGTSGNLIFLYRNANFATNVYAWLIYYTATTGNSNYFNGILFTPHAWTQTVLTYNSTGTVAVYRNGVLQNTQTIANFTQWNLNSANTPNINTSMVGQQNGSFGAYRYYNRALSQSEVTQNYNALKGRFGL